jgi:hypothetical protein
VNVVEQTDEEDSESERESEMSSVRWVRRKPLEASTE